MIDLNDYEIVDIPKEGCKKCVIADTAYCRHVFKWLTGYFCDYKMLVKKVKYEQCTRENTKAGDIIYDEHYKEWIVDYISRSPDRMIISSESHSEYWDYISYYRIKVED